MHPLILVFIFIASSAIGYGLIKNVPSLLHTPLMSGMNALSGVTVVGAIAAAGASVVTGNLILAYAAVVLAMLNIVAGFGVTHRMLKMFAKKDGRG